MVTDHLGTPRDLIGDDGRVRWSAAYTAWGKVHEEFIEDRQSPRGPPSETARKLESPLRLLGQYWDEETGLGSTRFRYWDPEHGRWCSPDPLGIDGGSNQCGFDGAPTCFADPLGLASDEWEVGTMDSLRPCNGFERHEIIQAAWLKHNVPGYTGRSGTMGKANPAIALYRNPTHSSVNERQRLAGLHDPEQLKSMSLRTNIRKNLLVLRDEMLDRGFKRDEVAKTIKRLHADALAYARANFPCKLKSK